MNGANSIAGKYLEHFIWEVLLLILVQSEIPWYNQTINHKGDKDGRLILWSYLLVNSPSLHLHVERMHDYCLIMNLEPFYKVVHKYLSQLESTG